ncbi:MAG: HAMP domain-containing histidine kinase [Chloroflexi bacterium]|nr:MAG: HAMP domain-containing histidine kinase [Chloroflexota bacterium]
MPAELKNVSSAVYDGESGDEKTDDKLSPYSSWRRRRLSGLLWQMTFFYGLLICVLLILLSIWTSYAILHITIQGVLLTSLQIVAALLIVIGVFALFFLALYLLRPLRRASDAAQAITLGDLQQRERLLPLMKGDDEVSRIATSLSIMGEQLERAKKVQQSSEQRFRRFISDASHQLRTPLTSIRGFTEVLMRGAKDDPETALRVLKLIKSEAERMTRLINDLLLLARLDEAQNLEKQVIDLVNLALEGVERAKELATDGRKIGIYFSTHERLNIQANADQLKQVLHILFDNAIKYGRPAPDGWIRLQLDCQDGYAIIQVIDNGKGIHPDDLPYIFERFYRGEHMSTYASPWKVPQGTGLGLSIARAIALAHEGTITVASTPEIETIFTVKIPRVTE